VDFYWNLECAVIPLFNNCAAMPDEATEITLSPID
jgi:hypothetical protein